MKKKGLLLLPFLLCGCTFNSQTMNQDLKLSLQDSSNMQAIEFTNMHKRLYDYYLPKDIGRISSNELSSVFKKDGTKFIMNFNPNAIVIRDYYYEINHLFMEMRDTKIISTSENGVRFEGTFKKQDGKVHSYSCVIDKLENGKYFMFLNMEYIYFYTIAYGAELESLSKSMFQIGQSVQFDSDQIVSIYSLKSSSEYLTENLDELYEELPESGYLSDLIGENK